MKSLVTLFLLGMELCVATSCRKADSLLLDQVRFDTLSQPATQLSTVAPVPTSQSLDSIIQLAPSGSTIVLPSGQLYTVRAPIRIVKPLTIEGSGSKVSYTGSDASAAFLVQSGNITIRSLVIAGRSSSSFVSGSNLISTKGSTNQKFYSNITIENCTFSNFKDCAVYLRYVRNFTVRNNVISQFPYGGIIMFSCVDGVISGNRISDITASGTVAGNAYGISVSRQNGLPTDTVPRNIFISKNEISNIPWEGIDTHGGDDFKVDSNRLINCSVGIAMVSTGSTSLGELAMKGPRNFSITNNQVTNLNVDAKSAIRIDGQNLPGQLATGVVVGNTCIGQSIKLENSKGVIVRNNLVDRPSSGYGILLNGYNSSTQVVSNEVRDVWLPLSNTSAAIGCRNEHNYVWMDGNLLVNNGLSVPSPAVKNCFGYRHVKGSANYPTFGRNNFSSAVITAVRY